MLCDHRLAGHPDRQLICSPPYAGLLLLGNTTSMTWRARSVISWLRFTAAACYSSLSHAARGLTIVGVPQAVVSHLPVMSAPATVKGGQEDEDAWSSMSIRPSDVPECAHFLRRVYRVAWSPCILERHHVGGAKNIQ